MSTKLVDKILWKKRKEIRRSKEEKDAEEWVLLRSLRPPQERMGQVSGPQVTGDLLGGWSRSAGKGGVKLAGMKFQSIREVLSPGRVLWEKIKIKKIMHSLHTLMYLVFNLTVSGQWWILEECIAESLPFSCKNGEKWAGQWDRDLWNIRLVPSSFTILLHIVHLALPS